MKRALSIAGAVGALLLAAAALLGNGTGPPGEPGKEATRGRLVLTVKEGAAWLHTFSFGGHGSVTARPQMAFWLEDAQGKFVATIYVTHKGATEDWGAPRGTEAERPTRPSALPVWSHKHREIGVVPMSSCAACHAKRKAADKSTAGIPTLDAITSATPEAGFTREWAVPTAVKPGTYVVRAEINHSLDWNDTYREGAAETDPNWGGGRTGSGQPSLVWQATIEIGAKAADVKLKPFGHGHPSGATGDVTPDLKTLTTALHIVEAVQAKYVP
jgi:hypothetical protein